MTERRLVEVYSAGCAICEEAMERVRGLACPSCEIVERDMRDPEVVREAQRLGIARVPAVVVDGTLASCCRAGGLDEEALRAAGIGSPL